ncbi:MAG: hypothetical protein F6K39_43390 [Okeania sp. SIO3B3]|nr:hypothetical protein [Okeania sp. SIO3B3]
MDINEFIEDKVNSYAEKIKTGSAKIDELALGEMTFYMALRRVIAGKGTPQDIGLMDAINDTLQLKGIINSGSSFLK